MAGAQWHAAPADVSSGLLDWAPVAGNEGDLQRTLDYRGADCYGIGQWAGGAGWDRRLRAAVTVLSRAPDPRTGNHFTALVHVMYIDSFALDLCAYQTAPDHTESPSVEQAAVSCEARSASKRPRTIAHR